MNNSDLPTSKSVILGFVTGMSVLIVMIAVLLTLFFYGINNHKEPKKQKEVKVYEPYNKNPIPPWKR